MELHGQTRNEVFLGVSDGRSGEPTNINEILRKEKTTKTITELSSNEQKGLVEVIFLERTCSNLRNWMLLTAEGERVS